MPPVTPTIGRIVIYRLAESDAEEINRRRVHARQHRDAHAMSANGVVVHTGNDVKAGDEYPMVITRVWGTTPGCAVNGQLLLDGNDTFWVTSTQEGDALRQFRWPQRS